VQEAKPRLEEQLEVHKKKYAAAIEDESRKYHAELKGARRLNSPETRPEHTPSIEEMEAEETRLFEEYKRVKITHGRRVNQLQRVLESQMAKIQEQVDRLGQMSTRCLADHKVVLQRVYVNILYLLHPLLTRSTRISSTAP
jgi:hypothetical protein